MPLHGLGVAAGQDEAGADAARRADGTEDVGRLGALIAGTRWAGCPAWPSVRVILFFWPTRASSCHQSSILVPAGSPARIAANAAGRLF